MKSIIVRSLLYFEHAESERRGGSPVTCIDRVRGRSLASPSVQLSALFPISALPPRLTFFANNITDY